MKVYLTITTVGNTDNFAVYKTYKAAYKNMMYDFKCAKAGMDEVANEYKNKDGCYVGGIQHGMNAYFACDITEMEVQE